MPLKSVFSKGSHYFSICCLNSSFLHEQLLWQSVLILSYIQQRSLWDHSGTILGVLDTSFWECFPDVFWEPNSEANDSHGGEVIAPKAPRPLAPLYVYMMCTYIYVHIYEQAAGQLCTLSHYQHYLHYGHYQLCNSTSLVRSPSDAL